MMDNRCLQPWLVIPASLLLAAAVQMPGVAGELADVKAIFANPPREYSSGPLWVWNDMLTEDQIRSTLHDLAGQHVKQAWVHPRPGLMTPYLGKDWFRMWNVALEEAERLDMNIWIYDENSYPSGFAGGLVPEAMPESRGKVTGTCGQRECGRRALRLPVVPRRVTSLLPGGQCRGS